MTRRNAPTNGRRRFGSAMVVMVVVLVTTGFGAGAGWAGAALPVKGRVPSAFALAAAGTTVPLADEPTSIRVTPDQKYAYITAAADDVVSVVDLRSRSLVADIAVGDTPIDLAFNRSGRTAYVVNRAGGTVSVIDTATRKVTRTIALGGSPSSIGVHSGRGGDQLFVADFGASEVRQMAARSGATMAQWPIQEPGGVAVSANGKVVVPSSADGSVLVIDSETGSAVTISRPDQSPTNPGSLSVRGNTVVLPGDETTWFDTVSGRFDGSLPAISPGVTSGSALLPGGLTLLTTRDFDDSVPRVPGVLSLVRPGDRVTVATMPVGIGAAGVAISSRAILVIQGPATDGQFSLLIVPRATCLRADR